MTTRHIAAVVQRGTWITVIGRNGDRASTTSRATADAWCVADGQRIDWTTPMPTLDGRTAYPLTPLEDQ